MNFISEIKIFAGTAGVSDCEHVRGSIYEIEISIICAKHMKLANILKADVQILSWMPARSIGEYRKLGFK